MTERGIHPEDAAAYAEQLTRALHRIAAAIEHGNDILEGITREDGALRVSQQGAWTTTTYTVQP